MAFCRVPANPELSPLGPARLASISAGRIRIEAMVLFMAHSPSPAWGSRNQISTATDPATAQSCSWPPAPPRRSAHRRAPLLTGRSSLRWDRLEDRRRSPGHWRRDARAQSAGPADGRRPRQRRRARRRKSRDADRQGPAKNAGGAAPETPPVAGGRGRRRECAWSAHWPYCWRPLPPAAVPRPAPSRSIPACQTSSLRASSANGGRNGVELVAQELDRHLVAELVLRHEQRLAFHADVIHIRTLEQPRHLPRHRREDRLVVARHGALQLSRELAEIARAVAGGIDVGEVGGD